MAALLPELTFTMCCFILSESYKQLNHNLTAVLEPDENPMGTNNRYFLLFHELIGTTAFVQHRFSSVLLIQTVSIFVSFSIRSFKIVNDFFPQETVGTVIYLQNLITAADNIIRLWIICSAIENIRQEVFTFLLHSDYLNSVNLIQGPAIQIFFARNTTEP